MRALDRAGRDLRDTFAGNLTSGFRLPPGCRQDCPHIQADSRARAIQTSPEHT